MSQVTITNFFCKRKRPLEDLKGRSKVLILEREVSRTNDNRDVLNNTGKVDLETLPSNHHPNKKLQSGSVSAGKRKVVRFDESKNTRINIFSKRSSSISKTPKYDIRKSFQKAATNISGELNAERSDSTVDEPEKLQEAAVVEETPSTTSALLHNAVLPISSGSSQDLDDGSSKAEVQVESIPVTPTKTTSQTFVEAHGSPSVLSKNAVASTESRSGTNLVVGSSGEDVRAESSLMTPTKKTSQDLTLSEIKSRLSRSDKLRQAISTFSKASARCAQLEAARKKLDKAGPQLQSFEKVEVEFSTSPQKVVQKTPEKTSVSSPHKRAVISPQKTSSLPLPYSYRGLAEMFRCVDVVVSMLYNRNEAVTFKKVKAAVQEMMHRTFTEHHLGQIKAVFSDAYIFHQEKLRNFGSTSKADTYELTLTPVLSPSSKNERSSLLISEDETPKLTDKITMTPSCILERKRSFYNNLLERVFEQHEKFLSSLDPPLVIPREELVRWHPQFEVDTVEEIVPQELPQPPNVRKFTSAKDVLDKAKDLFSCNRRLHNALQEMSGGTSSNTNQSTISSDKDILSSKQDTVQSTLKGIPKSLLEKVRARQAAKARLTMMTPEQDKDSVEHSRLPELARILRNMFVTEKKGAIPLEVAILKLQNSYREKLSAREVEHHIRLMIQQLPGWIAIYSIRNADYLKLSRNGDMTKVLQKLEATALEKKNNTQLFKPL